MITVTTVTATRATTTEAGLTLGSGPPSSRCLRTGRRAPLSELRGRPVHALAGIGNPRRFFDMLRSLGAELRATAFPDHHRFSQADLASRAGEWLVMTAKDAVKCRGFAPDNAWYLAVEAEVPDAFLDAFLAQLDASARQFNDARHMRTDHG